jgi:hypothetical protein
MIDPASEEGKKLVALYEKDNRLRGAYLVQAITIEGIIGDIISLSLCPNEDSRSLFTSLILNKFSFDGKSKILERLLESKYPTIVNKNVFAEIEKVRQFRNKLAHGMPVTSDEFLAENYTDGIQLDYYDSKGHRRTIDITDTDFREKLRNCSGLVTKLIEIRNEITRLKT